MESICFGFNQWKKFSFGSLHFFNQMLPNANVQCAFLQTNLPAAHPSLNQPNPTAVHPTRPHSARSSSPSSSDPLLAAIKQLSAQLSATKSGDALPNGSKAPHTRNVIGRQAAMNVDGVGAANSFPKSLRTTLATKSTERHMFHHAIDVDAHTSPISCKAPEDPDHLMPNTGLPQVCDTDGLTRKNFFFRDLFDVNSTVTQSIRREHGGLNLLNAQSTSAAATIEQLSRWLVKLQAKRENPVSRVGHS